MRRLFLLLVLTTAAPAMAEASSRSFSLPTGAGQAISDCLADGTSCGKAAADQFCKKEGFAESILFARERVTFAAAIDGNRNCSGDACEAFTRIKCYTPEEEQANSQ
jgi:hypothetical protein